MQFQIDLILFISVVYHCIRDGNEGQKEKKLKWKSFLLYKI